jgi:hypothetical protein
MFGKLEVPILQRHSVPVPSTFHPFHLLLIYAEYGDSKLFLSLGTDLPNQYPSFPDEKLKVKLSLCLTN